MFYQLEGAEIPTRFQGFYEPVGDEGFVLRKKDPEITAAWTSTGFEVDCSVVRSKITTFYVEAYCILIQSKANTKVASGKYHCSCVRPKFIEAELFFADPKAGPRNPTSISRDRLNSLFQHELGHYKITRLIALDLYRAVLELQSRSFPSGVVAMRKFNALEAEYKFIRELVQGTYELVTSFGGNQQQQQRWNDILAKADADAGDWRIPKSRLGPTFWPGLEFNLASAPAGVPQLEADLGKTLKGMYGSTTNPNRMAAQAFRSELDLKLTAAQNVAKNAAQNAAAAAQQAGHP
jgi:hypothetical protein